MDFYTQITQDFFFMLDLCKHPKDVFSANSRDYDLANKWLDKLCRMECSSLNERRWRNVYMSHLLVCMNEGTMKEPFNENPPRGSLEVFDFVQETSTGADKAVAPSGMSLNASQHSSKPAAGASFHETCEPSIPKDCSQNVNSPSKQASVTLNPSSSKAAHWAGSQDLSKTNKICSDENIGCFGKCSRSLAKYRPHFVSKRPTGGDPPLPPPPKAEQQYYCGFMTEHLNAVDCASALAATSEALQSRSCHDEHGLDCSSLDDDIEDLLEAISAELRGDRMAGANAYLEKELLRYKEFMMSYSNMALVLQKTRAQNTMRSFLLLNLQNDLVKLMNDIKK